MARTLPFLRGLILHAHAAVQAQMREQLKENRLLNIQDLFFTVNLDVHPFCKYLLF